MAPGHCSASLITNNNTRLTSGIINKLRILLYRQTNYCEFILTMVPALYCLRGEAGHDFPIYIWLPALSVNVK